METSGAMMMRAKGAQKNQHLFGARFFGYVECDAARSVENCRECESDGVVMGTFRKCMLMRDSYTYIWAKNPPNRGSTKCAGSWATRKLLLSVL